MVGAKHSRFQLKFTLDNCSRTRSLGLCSLPRLGRKRCRELESPPPPPPPPHPGPTPLSLSSVFGLHFLLYQADISAQKHSKTRCRRNFRKMCLIYVKKVRSVTCKFKCCGQKLVALFTAFHQPNAGQHRAVSCHFLQQGPHKEKG